MTFPEGTIEDIEPVAPTSCESAGQVLASWVSRYFTRDTIFDAKSNGWFCVLDKIDERNDYVGSCSAGLNGRIGLRVSYTPRPGPNTP